MGCTPATLLAQPLGNTGAATLIFTATSLSKGYQGINIGTGTLHLSASKRVNGMVQTTTVSVLEVDADHPEVRVTIPAGQPLIMTSSWSGGGAFCLLKQLTLVPHGGAIYKLTNAQDINSNRCRLYLQRLS